MKTLFLTAALLLACTTSVAQNEEDAIRESLQSYIDGSSYNDPEKIVAPFYEDARMFLSKKDQPIWILSAAEYAELFKKREKGKFNGRVGTILSVDRANDIATAKVEININKGEMIFIDLFILKKLEDQWKIISKAATRMPEG
ncbi:nuclear transport factor 2 family protein [Maribacter sp. 2308TA10-17]|uniref:nuclear transport factor 2 family protein n=1 Tax=Maribacter sp. 2308TA10-17 TaxID=3386276 RepID=UPI0039BCF799